MLNVITLNSVIMRKLQILLRNYQKLNDLDWIWIGNKFNNEKLL